MCESNDDYLQRIMREAQESQARVRAEVAARAAENEAIDQRMAELAQAAQQTGARYDKFKSELSDCVDKSAEAFARELAARGTHFYGKQALNLICKNQVRKQMAAQAASQWKLTHKLTYIYKQKF